MTKMISIKDASPIIGVVERRLRLLCAQGRVLGAQKIGGSWIVPKPITVLASARSRPGKINFKNQKA